MMFKKRKRDTEEIGIIKIGDHVYTVNRDVKKYIHDLRFENRKLEEELELIKPVLEHPDLKPALSNRCDDCKFVVRSRWDGHILGCRKDALCEDFVEREE